MHYFSIYLVILVNILVGGKKFLHFVRGGLGPLYKIKGGYITFPKHLGGVRVSRPSAANFKHPPPLDVFGTFP